MRLLLLSCILAFAARSQAPDAFTGSWSLNVQKSHFIEPDDTYTGGTRTYSPAKTGTHVTWTMLDANKKKKRGGYTVVCKNGSCVSKVARWKPVDARTVEGEVLHAGKVLQTYTRTVSPDGATLTIRFFRTGTKTETGTQVWERIR